MPPATPANEFSATEASENPGLASFDISGYTGVAGLNFFAIDPLLQRLLDRHLGALAPAARAAVDEHLDAFGELVGGELNELTIAAHQEGRYGELVPYSPTGERIDEIVYCHEQQEIRRLCFEHGIVNLNYHPDWPHEFTTAHRMGLAYLANQNGEGGVTCPLAMTDGLIKALEAIGTPEQKERYLPLLTDPDSDSHFMAGQYVTERVGGSNVAQNRTLAYLQPDGSYRLFGEKWFCSNPGDLWVTTARVVGADGEPTQTIGMFLVPRETPDGELNSVRLLRKKEIIGSRGKLTVESSYEHCYAEALGRPAHGLANLIKYVIGTSRVHVAVSACGTSRRAFLEARAYTEARTAYGQRVIDFPIVLRSLAEMQIRHSAIMLCNFLSFEFAAANKPIAQLLTPLMKYISTVHATWITHAAMMLHGGNGILSDFSVLPRLHNDAIINETWEGTHNVIGEHVLKAFARPKVRDAFFAYIEECLAEFGEGAHAFYNDADVQFACETLQSRLRFVEECAGRSAADPWLANNRLAVARALYDCFGLAEFLRETAEGEELFHSFAAGFAELVACGSAEQPTRAGGFFEDSGRQAALVAY